MPADPVGKDAERPVVGRGGKRFRGDDHRRIDVRYHAALSGANPNLGRLHRAPERRVDDVGERLVDRDAVAVLDLDQHVERRRRLPLEHRLLRSTAAGLLVGKGHALDAAEQVVEGRVDEQVLERLAVRGRDQLHAALGDGARGRGLELGADLVDDDHLGHVVLDRLDHHRVLQKRSLHLHPARPADARMRDVAVSSDLVRGVDDHDSLAQLVGEQPRALAQHRGLADPRTAEQENALPAHDDVADDLASPGDRAPNPHGQADDPAGPVANRRNAMQRALDSGAVVVAELADVVGHVIEVGRRDRMVRQQHLATGDAGFGLAAQVEHDLQKLPWIGPLVQCSR